MVTYAEVLTETMTALGKRDDILFIGQSVAYPGNTIFKTLEGVPMEKRLELPVMEEAQLGMSIGLAMTGKTVISIFPRMDFLMCAMNQLVNHLDKDIYPLKGRLIIRTCVGSTTPMYPGVQHCGNYSMGLRALLKNVPVYELTSINNIHVLYDYCSGVKIDRYHPNPPKASILVEIGDLYGMVGKE